MLPKTLLCSSLDNPTQTMARYNFSNSLYEEYLDLVNSIKIFFRWNILLCLSGSTHQVPILTCLTIVMNAHILGRIVRALPTIPPGLALARLICSSPLSSRPFVQHSMFLSATFTPCLPYLGTNLGVFLSANITPLCPTPYVPLRHIHTILT